MCDIVYEKTNGRGRRLKRVSVYAEASVRKKKCYSKFRRFHKKTSVLESLVLIKLNSVDLQLH